MPSPLLYIRTVEPGWVDYNGHMQDAYYLLVFSDAISALMDEVGVDAAYRARTKGTIYTLEYHLHYLKEVKGGVAVQCGTRLLDADAKRMHIWQELRHPDSGDLLAAAEAMLLHVSQAGDEPGAAPFPTDIDDRVQAMLDDHRQLPEPDHRARAIGIRRKSQTE